MLPECLGKEFYQKKKFPCPIKLHGSDAKTLQKTLNEASESVYFMQGNGPNYSVRVGKTSQDDKDIADNVEAALAKVLS